MLVTQTDTVTEFLILHLAFSSDTQVI